MRFARAFALAALTLTSIPALAWDDTGHRVVGIIAYSQLSPEKQEKLNAILKQGEPSFAYNNNHPSLRLAAATTFPDFIKGKTSESYEKEINYYNDWAFPVNQRKPNNNEATRMRVWHYVNRPLFTDNHGDHIDHAPFDAVKAINFINTQYPKESTDKMRAFWIYFASHIIGDLHQPLHCAASCAEDGRGDAGGNFFKLSGDPRNLHFLWDSGITDATSKPEWRGGHVEKAAKIVEMFPPSTFKNEIGNLNPDSWADEGATLAKRVVYSGIQQNTKESPQYSDIRQKTSLRQAALAGYRLANCLDKLIK